MTADLDANLDMNLDLDLDLDLDLEFAPIAKSESARASAGKAS